MTSVNSEVRNKGIAESEDEENTGGEEPRIY